MTTVHDLITFAFICPIIALNTQGLQAARTFHFSANYEIADTVPQTPSINVNVALKDLILYLRSIKSEAEIQIKV